MRKQFDIALEAIRKKLVGKTLTYHEIYAIMDEIAHERLGDVLTTYFAASEYSRGFTKEELYYLTKAMVETGEKLSFSGIVADKHSIGGMPGTRTTMIIVPIIAAAGFCIPKSSSRAITTPGGTADDMETLARVEFDRDDIYDIVRKTNGCIVWGGSFKIAPADDVMIRVEHPLSFESYDKVVISIMAKKIAFGSTHVVIDIPYGPSMKVHRKSDAVALKQKFHYIAEKFDITLHCEIHEVRSPLGVGIGPILETADALQVLEQHPARPRDLESHALLLAGELLDMCLYAERKQKNPPARTHNNGHTLAAHILHNGHALTKMKQIVAAQGGDATQDSERLLSQLGKHTATVAAASPLHVTHIDSKSITKIAKILGCPHDKGAGILLHAKLGDRLKKGDPLFTLYAQRASHLKEAQETLGYVEIYRT
jgi:putative thymidine phosphorylase